MSSVVLSSRCGSHVATNIRKMVRVTVSEGILEGEEVNNVVGGKFYSFKGIPYAQPPVGNLRFKVKNNLDNNIKGFSICDQRL